MIRAATAAPVAIPAIAPDERGEDERAEETGLELEVKSGLMMVDEVVWVVLKEAAKDGLLVLVDADAVLDVAKVLGVTVVLGGAEIVVNIENALKVMCDVLSQSQL